MMIAYNTKCKQIHAIMNATDELNLFHTVQSCVDGTKINVEWFYVNWITTDKNESGMCCFFLFRNNIGKTSCNVMLVKHDLVNEDISCITYLSEGHIEFTKEMLEDNIHDKTISACMDAVFTNSKCGKFINHVVEDSNFSCSSAPFSLNAHGFQLYQNNGGYELLLRDGTKIEFESEKPLIDLFDGTLKVKTTYFEYLVFSRLKMKINNVEAHGEFDHQWGDVKTNKTNWLWCGCRLNNNTEIFYYDINGTDKKVRIVDQNGKMRTPIIHSVVINKWWTSPSSLQKYPVELTIKYENNILVLKCLFDNQQVESALRISCFYEGIINCELQDSESTSTINGMGFIECVKKPLSLDQDDQTVEFRNYFRDYRGWMEKITNKALKLTENNNEYLSSNQLPSGADFNLLGDDGYKSYNKDMLEPVIHSLNGSTWRSAILGILIRMFTNKRELIDAGCNIAFLFELLQTLSLMIDDIQDKSDMRRGKVCAYKIYGENTTYMSALCASTMWGQIIDDSGLPEHIKREIYRLYPIKEKHLYLGQLEDVSYDTDTLSRNQDMEELLENGKCPRLVKRILRMHALKTGTSMGFVFELAGLIGGRDRQSLDILYKAGMEFGTSYQLCNDLLDYDITSAKAGDDIKCKKITYPFLMALANMDKQEKIKILMIMNKSEPLTEKEIDTVMKSVNDNDGILNTKQKISELCNNAWNRLIKLPNLSTSVALFEFSVVIGLFLKDVGQPWNPTFLNQE